MTIVNKPDMNAGIWAEAGNVETPSSEKIEEGWVIEKPLNEWMNWIQNRQDKMLFYLNQVGVPEWDSFTEYPQYALTSFSGTLYQAISQNIDVNPTLNTDIWQTAFVKYQDYISYAEKVDKIENEDGYLTHYVKKSSPVMTATAKGIAYNNSTGVSGLSFNALTPKITSDNKTVAEFSGGSNPKDVVTHEQLAIAIQNYKVGDVYITMGEGDPSTRLGYGTWERFAEGKTLVGFNTSVSNSIPEWTKVIAREYGEYDHKLSIDEMPRHTHDMNFTTGNISGNDRPATQNTSSFRSNLEVAMTGGDLPHNNVQPSIVVYFWKRIS